MLAVVFDKHIETREVPPPKLRAGEAVIKVSLGGICNTDLEIAKGYMGFTGILGHEFTGTVVKCRDKKWIGRRVVGEINAACGKCDYCKRGLGRHCPHRTVLGIAGRDGAFAELVSLPVKNLVAVPKSISDEQAVFTEPLAACFEILDQVKIKPGQSVAVIGDGKLGALAASVLSIKCDGVLLIGKHPEKLDRIRKAFKVKTSEVKSMNNRGIFDVVVECSGSPSGLETATSLLKPRGTLVLKSTFHKKPCIDTSLWVINELTVVGSRCGRFRPAVAAMAGGAIDPTPLVDAVYPAIDAPSAFKAAASKGAFKILLDFNIRR